MPCTSDCIGQILVEGESVETMAFYSVVSCENAHQYLYAPEDDDDQEVFECRAL